MNLPKFEDMFKQIMINFKIIGIPKDGSKLGFHFFSLYVVLTFIIIEESSFFISKLTSETSEDSASFLQLTALAPCIGMGLLSLVKIICIASKRQKIFNLMAQLKLLYDNTLVHDNFQVITSDIKSVKSLTKYFFFLNAALISIYNFSTLFIIIYHYFSNGLVVYSLPYAVTVPFSTDVWSGWFVVYTHSIIAGFICVFYFTTVDALYYNLCCLVCSNFTVLNNDILGLDSKNTHILNDLLKRHQHLLELAEYLEDIFTAPNLFNVLVGSIEICALGFNLMVGTWADFPGVVLFLTSELLQIFVMSVFGDNIMRESRQVGQSAFMCKWFEMDVRSQKVILIMMIRANKPKNLTAYKFSTISYASFTKIVSTSWSYFTILRNVYSDIN